MAKYSKESLEKLLLLIDEISSQGENLWFKEEIQKRHSINPDYFFSLNVLHQDLRRTKSFLKYIDGQYWREGFNFYKKIKDSDLKITLTSDFKEMKIAENENNILEYVRRLILQLENIFNCLISKFDAHTVIINNPNVYKDNHNNLIEGKYSFFNDDKSPKHLKDISLPTKLFWVKTYFNINYTYKVWNDLTFLRNKASHRENLREEDKNKLEQIENDWDVNKTEYNKFFNSVIKQLIQHI
jgi:hypothetical protein